MNQREESMSELLERLNELYDMPINPSEWNEYQAHIALGAALCGSDQKEEASELRGYIKREWRRNFIKEQCSNDIDLYDDREFKRILR
jgi:hypothetical protein